MSETIIKKKVGRPSNSKTDAYLIRLKTELGGEFHEFVNVGGYKSKNKKKNHPDHQIIIKNNKLLAFEEALDIVKPASTGHCSCGHKIKYDFFVYHPINKTCHIVGSCCIKKFEIATKCSNCNVVHGRTKFSLCVDCDKDNKKAAILERKAVKKAEKEAKLKDVEKNKLGKQKFKFGMHKHKLFSEVAISYFKWCWNKNNYEPNNMFEPVVEYYEKYMMM